MKKIILTILVASIAQFALAQSAHKSLREGNKAYEQEEFSAAAEAYYKALENDPSNIKGKFNLGNATYQKEGFDEAIQHYSSAAELAQDDATKADAYYNLGNSFFQKAKAEEGKGLEKSIEAYKNSLRLNPKDLDTKKNLALTQRLLQRQQQQQQQQQQDQKKDQEKKDDEKKDEQQQQQNQDEQQQDQNQQGEEKDAKEQQQPKDLNKEEAMELLKIMDDEEKKVQEKLRKAKGDGKKPDKDW